MIDFTKIEYLTSGNPRQQRVFKLLVDNKIFDILSDYSPILVGTIPIGIDIETSDLDIVCEWHDKHNFNEMLVGNFKNYKGFSVHETFKNEVETVICRFAIDEFKLEIFGNNVPSNQQQAYRHMLVEHRILKEQGEKFKQAIINLKRQGYKTEPAFAMLLGLKGDPYFSLLDY